MQSNFKSGRLAQMRFTGDAKTYFGIWIVNVLLSIVTLGIYSAWAKVRNKRYFMQNTVLEGRRFDYHATGMQIFLGRLIVIGGLIVLAIPFVNIAGVIALFFLFPWLINRALAFNARMSSFSGLRFGFAGDYWGAMKAYMLYPVLTLFTLYTTLPFAIRAQHRYTISNHRYGTAPFAFESPIGPFYKAFGFAVLWGVVALVLAFTALGGGQILAEFMIASRSGAEPDPAVVVRFLVLYFVVILALLPAGFIYFAYLRQALYAGTMLDGKHGFISTLKPMQLLWVALSNAAVVVPTLGLMIPWARVRMARLLADNTQLVLAGSLDDFVAGQSQKVSAIGDAYADIEGIDIGLAL